MKARGKSFSRILIIIIASIIPGLTSCFESNYDINNISNDVELTPGISVPLAYGSLTLEKILNEIDTGDFVKPNATDSLLYITYSKDLISYNASEVVKIPDQDFLQIFIDSDVATATLLPVGVGETAHFTKNKNGEFTFTKGEKIDSLNLKSVRMFIDVNSSFHHSGNLVIYSDNIFLNRKPFTKTIKISNASGSFSYSLDTLLTNVNLILDNSNADTTVLPLKFDLNLINSGAPVLPTEKCNITMSFRENAFSSVFGYLGEYDILVNSGQIDVSLFNQTLQGGSLKFADPRLALTINNSYGIPVQIDLSGTEVVSSINEGLVTPITFTPGTNPFNIAAPDTTQFGEAVFSEIPINKDNSNIVAAMETSPNHLNYSATAKTNAQGPGGPYNFVTDSSTMDLGLEVVLPIWVKAEGFSMQDTVDFDFEKQFGTNLDIIDYFRLTLEADNGLPIEATLQIYFTDASYTVLDSLFKENTVLLDPATIGVNGKVNAPKSMTDKVELSATDLETIKPSKFALVKASLNTPATGTGYFKFYSYYGIDFRLSAKANFTINPKNL